MSVNEVIQHGWLVKSPQETKDRLFGGLIKKQWKKRYFVLTYISQYKKIPGRSSLTPSFNSSLNINTSFNDRKSATEPDRLELTYYESDQMQRLQGCIDLMRCEEVLDHVQSSLFKHVFAIKTYHKKTKPRTYFLVAASESEMMAWVGHLTNYLRVVLVSPVTGLGRSLQRQPSFNGSSHTPTIANHHPSPYHHSNIPHSSTISNLYSSSTNNLDPKFFQNNLSSTLNRKNRRSNENSPSLPRAPFLKRMDSITQRSEMLQNKLMEKHPDQTLHQSSRNQALPCLPLPDLHAFLPLLTHNSSTLPRNRVQCHAGDKFSLYDHPSSTKKQHMFYDRVNGLLKYSWNSIDHRKPHDPLGAVYDVPANKNQEPPSHISQSLSHSNHPYLHTTNSSPLHSSEPYDVPASLKTPSNRYIYDTPGASKAASVHHPLQTSEQASKVYSESPGDSGLHIPDSDSYSMPIKASLELKEKEMDCGYNGE